MSNNEKESFDQYDIFFQNMDEQGREVEATLKRFKAKDGIPVTSADQLEDLTPKHQEARYVKLDYDRFSAGLKPEDGTGRPSV